MQCIGGEQSPHAIDDVDSILIFLQTKFWKLKLTASKCKMLLNKCRTPCASALTDTPEKGQLSSAVQESEKRSEPAPKRKMFSK